MLYVTALVFLSSPEPELRLYEVGRHGVAVRDADDGQEAADDAFGSAVPGVVQVLKDPSGFGLRASAINRPTSRKVAEAIEQAGIAPANRGRKAGDWELGELLDEGAGWQDFAAHRPKLVADHVLDGRVHELPGAGHAAPLTNPEALAEALVEFFGPVQRPA